MKFDEYIHSRTFGVEIECYNVNKSHLIREIAPKYGLTVISTGWDHHDQIDGKTFKLGFDGSITGSNPCECVTPVLTYNEKGIELLKKMIKALKEEGAKFNESCSVHLHIGVSYIKATHYKRIFNNYYFLEGVIDSFMRINRRGDDCKWAGSINLLQLNRIMNTKRKREVYQVLCSRYFKVNPKALLDHNTIEFRQHAGSLNENEILNWLSFCVKLVCWSKDHELTAKVNHIKDIPFITDEEKKYFAHKVSYYKGLYAINEDRRNNQCV